MPTNPKAREDAALSAAPVVKAAVDVAATMQNLEKDLALLRARIDAGDRVSTMSYAVLSAQLFAAELLQRLVKLQIALADEGAM
jgi:hypothetical protein